MVLGAAEGEHALQVRCPATVYELRDLRRAYERDRLDARVIADRLHDILSAMHHLKHTFRKSCFIQQLRDLVRAQRHELRWLEDQAVSESDCIWNGPVRDHVREIEWRNRRYDSEWIALDPALYS